MTGNKDLISTLPTQSTSYTEKMVFSGELITIEDSDGEYETSADEQPTRKQNPVDTLALAAFDTY